VRRPAESLGDWDWVAKAEARLPHSKLVGEPVAAVGDPPTDGQDGYGGEEAPHQGEGEVG